LVIIKLKNATNITAIYFCNATSCHTISEFLTGGSGSTNETERFGNLVDGDCSGSDKMVGVLTNGTIFCAAAAGGGDFSKTDFGPAFDQNISLFNLVNSSLANATYALIGSGGGIDSATANSTYWNYVDTFFQFNISNFFDNLVTSTIGNNTYSKLTDGQGYFDTNVSDAELLSSTQLNLSYANLSRTISKGNLTDTGTLNFDWVDSEVSDTLTIGSSSTVDKGALANSGTLSFDWVILVSLEA